MGVYGVGQSYPVDCLLKKDPLLSSIPHGCASRFSAFANQNITNTESELVQLLVFESHLLHVGKIKVLPTDVDIP